jgi:putative transposase
MSGKRYEILTTNEIYHVFNKSVGYEDVFTKKKELRRIFDLINYYRYNPGLSFSKYKNLPLTERQKFLNKTKSLPKIVDIYAFAFMPNHFHLLIKQLEKNGIKIFLSNIQNGYAKYFNIKEKRDGTLFQKAFKAKRVVNDEIFLHLSRYIHLNPVTSYLIDPDKLQTYPWTSYPYYLKEESDDLINTKTIITLTGSITKYDNFVTNQIDYQKRLQRIKKYLLD